LGWAAVGDEVAERHPEDLHAIGSREFYSLAKGFSIAGIQPNAYVSGEPFLWGAVLVVFTFGHGYSQAGDLA
jgi:hypothetical protein